MRATYNPQRRRPDLSVDGTRESRLWRTIKYEEVYLRAYDSVSQARDSLRKYIEIYNSQRPYSGLAGLTPDEVYFKLSALPEAA